MRIILLLFFGISISLATNVSKTETTAERKATDVKKTATATETPTLTTPIKPAVTTHSKTKITSSTRQSKVLKTATAGAPGENRGKRTLYDFENAGYLYPEIANRRAGYTTDTHAGYYPQAGFYNGQNAIAQYPSDFGGHYAHYPQYLEAPEPIIEIIIKDSNETLPTYESPQPIVTKKKKEKVHVFYVNYKKDENNKLHLESPIASLNNDDEPQTDHDTEEEILQYPQVVTPLPILKATTLRTIIHPDSEKYHSNSGIHVSFGSEDKSQTGHILEEHNAESIQRQVVALPIDNSADAPKSLVESYFANTRSDYAHGRSPAVGNSLYTAPFHQPQQNNYYQVQQQQLPAQHASNYFRSPTPPTPAAATQHQQNFYQEKQLQKQQQRPAFAALPAQQQQPQAQPLYRKPPPPPPPSQTTQQQIQQQLQQQSHYYVNHNQQYQQSQQQQQSYSPNQFYHQQTNSYKHSKPSFFPTTSPKQQELPSRHAPPPYQPIKFRPTPMPAPQIKPVPVPIPAKLENSHYQSAHRQEQRYPQEQHQHKQQQQQQQHYYQQQQQQKQQHFSFNRQQQQFAQSTPDLVLPSTGSLQSNFYKTQTQPQQQQQQQQQLPISAQNTVSQTKFQSAPSTQSHVNSAPSALSSLHNYFNVQPSKETELLKSIPKFEQHITETIHHQPVQQQDTIYNQYSYTQRNEVIHDIPAPNLGPTLRPNVLQVQQPLPASPASSGHYITQQQSNSQPQYSNFVTTSQSISDSPQQQYSSSTAEPQYAQSTDGQKIMIVTPMPPINSNNFQQYHSSHYQSQQSANLQPQIIYNSQPLQTQATNNFAQQPRNPTSSVVHSTIQTAPSSGTNSHFSVSTYHSDVFKELEQRKQAFQAHQQYEPSQGAYIPPTSSATTPATAQTTATPTTTVAPKSAKASQTLLQLPDEVPEDLRQQLLTSGILNNADISVLDYDKVGDVALENLPAEHLQHFYGAGGGAQISESNKVVTVVKPNGDSVALSEKDIERVKQSNSLPQRQKLDVKVVRFGAHNEKSVTDKYLKTDATVVPPVDLADRQYNRYLPLKINGAQFPLPDAEELRGKKVVSVVVLAPVEAQSPTQSGGSDKRTQRDASDAKEVKFLGGDLIKTLVKKPTKENFKRWLEKEARSDVEMQSVVLLVAKASEDAEQEIFMYDITSGAVNKLNGELSSAFVNVAEENASSEDLEHASTLDPNILETMMHKNQR